MTNRDKFLLKLKKIAFHENRIAMHKSAIRRLKKEKSILMMKGEWVKDGR